MPGINPPMASSGGGHAQPPYSPAQQHLMLTEAEVLRHQLRLRDSHIAELTQTIHQRDLTIAELEVHLEYAKGDTQAVLKSVALLSRLLDGGPSQKTLFSGSLSGRSSQGNADLIETKQIFDPCEVYDHLPGHGLATKGTSNVVLEEDLCTNKSHDHLDTNGYGRPVHLKW
jgi:hypothetical protein